MVRATKPCYEEEIVSRIDEDKEPWFYDIENYIRDGGDPENAKPSERTTLRKLASQFILFEGILYKRAFDGMQLKCVNQQEAQEIMKEIRSGECGTHMNGLALAKKIMRQGMYWITMESDCIQFVKKCNQCQIYGDISHMPPTELQSMTVTWPFCMSDFQRNQSQILIIPPSLLLNTLIT